MQPNLGKISIKARNEIPSHDIFYTEWGNPDNKNLVICVHGLTRNSRDFDYLAKSLSENYRVICPDIVGRGKSDWFKIKELYNYQTYTDDMIEFISYFNSEQVNWIGTSMGGLIGMMLNAKLPKLINKMILNDIGPFIPSTALKRIAKYVSIMPVLDDLDHVERYLRMILAPFGIKKDEDWRYIAQHSFIKKSDGTLTLAYDPNIAYIFADHSSHELIPDVDLWDLWHLIKCQILLIRGGNSDILLAETADLMLKTKEHITLFEFPGIGHTPSLMDDEHITLIKNWLK